MLDEFGVLGAVVGVEPFVRGQDQLREAITEVGLDQPRLVARVERQRGDHLQCQTN